MEFKKVKKLIKSEVLDVDTKGVVTIQITQFDKFDEHNDRMLKGCFTKTWKEGDQVHLLDHVKGLGSYVGLPIKKDSENGIIESKLNLNKQIAKDLYEDYKFSQENGRSLQHSHYSQGFKDKAEKNERGGWDLKEVRQYEYSTVLFGAVSDTPLLAIKDNQNIIEMVEDLEMRLKSIDYSDLVRGYLSDYLHKIKTLVLKPSEDTLTETKHEPSTNTQMKYLIENFKL